MKTEKNIFLAFILNLAFSVFEFIGGVITGSVAIISDAVHDMGDAVSIGISYLFEKKSKKQPDEVYTYGYARYSVLGGFISTIILTVGSTMVICNSVYRVFYPNPINYNGMIVFAIIGLLINSCAAYVTRDGDSVNQKAVNLHMLEDVLGWAVILVGAVLMRFTGMYIIDPLMSLGVAVFILINSAIYLKGMIDLFLEKIPYGLDLKEIKGHLCEIEGVAGVHHIHVRSTDGQKIYATMHIVINGDAQEIKQKVRDELREHGIIHSTLEIEYEGEMCEDELCRVEYEPHSHHHHHNHHH